MSQASSTAPNIAENSADLLVILRAEHFISSAAYLEVRFVSTRRRRRHGLVFHELTPLCLAAVISITHNAMRRASKTRRREGVFAFRLLAGFAEGMTPCSSANLRSTRSTAGSPVSNTADGSDIYLVGIKTRRRATSKETPSGDC
jgi:hypothetical protein